MNWKWHLISLQFPIQFSCEKEVPLQWGEGWGVIPLLSRLEKICGIFHTEGREEKKQGQECPISSTAHFACLTQRVTWLSDLFRLQLKIPHNFLKTPFSYHSMHHAQIIKSVVYRLPTCLLSFDCMNGFPYSPLGQKMMLTFMYIYLA